jgi:hypothetical protein
MAEGRLNARCTCALNLSSFLVLSNVPPLLPPLPTAALASLLNLNSTRRGPQEQCCNSSSSISTTVHGRRCGFVHQDCRGQYLYIYIWILANANRVIVYSLDAGSRAALGQCNRHIPLHLPSNQHLHSTNWSGPTNSFLSLCRLYVPHIFAFHPRI